ncbi:putative dCMP deaminase family protein [Octadecabacter antarcticus 307]|uniref:Putative dCMP deaminase family protein n=1 Tax=Octadecabacter antarcticus 307 TaxID=391626 RepID=M9RAE8_9RHOB|nr:deaminase [Octadecabacter antarcticus]AGI66730.1 putative dCMP deaminase family protein [Octadecabacter antarcticus 307]
MPDNVIEFSPECHVTEDTITNWDRRFFQLSNTIAGWSEDQSRKVGCVIVSQENGILSTGYNGFPREVLDKPDRHSSLDGEKYYWFEHAERNAIYNAVRSGSALLNSRLYVNLFPCADCTRAIIQSGVKELNTFAPDQNEKFFQRSFEVSISMLNEASVQLRLFPENAVV